jgi:hypothetical protein
MGARTGQAKTLAAGDNDLFTVPNLFKGRFQRLVLRNPNPDQDVIVVKDYFTPDASNGVSTPTAVTRTLWSGTVEAGDTVDIPPQGEALMDDCYGTIRINSTLGNTVASYVVEWR